MSPRPTPTAVEPISRYSFCLRYTESRVRRYTRVPPVGPYRLVRHLKFARHAPLSAFVSQVRLVSPVGYRSPLPSANAGAGFPASTATTATASQAARERRRDSRAWITTFHIIAVLAAPGVHGYLHPSRPRPRGCLSTRASISASPVRSVDQTAPVTP